MRLGVPLYESSDWLAGSIYIANLTAALKRLPDAERPEVLVLSGPRRRLSFKRRQRPRRREGKTYGYYDGRAAHVAAASALISLCKGGSCLSLTRVARRAAIDVLFPIASPLPEGVGVPWIGWVPDFQYMVCPHYWPAGHGHTFTWEMERLARRSPFLVVSSEDARRHAETFFGRRDKVDALPFAILPTVDWYDVDPREVAAHHRLPERFIIFPSQFWKHKDHPTLIRAIKLLRDRGHLDIVLALPGWPEDTRDPAYGPAVLRLISALGMERQVRVLGLVERRDLIALMRRAVGVVQPSRFEGWSALVEEARSLGKAMVVSDIGVHKEQQPNNARFFKAGDAEDLAEAVLALWERNEPGPEPAKEALARAQADHRAQAFARRFVATATEAIRTFKEELACGV